MRSRRRSSTWANPTYGRERARARASTAPASPMYVYNKFTSLTGVTLPHKSTYQATYGTAVDKEDLLPGDLVFFGSPIGHVGMYVGNGLMINAPRSGDLVCIEDVFRSNYVTARRLISPYARIQQTSSLLGYAGPWALAASSSSASGGSYGYVDSPGASVTVKFNGTYLKWISKKSTAYGLARVTLDGVDAGTVNLYSLDHPLPAEGLGYGDAAQWHAYRDHQLDRDKWR